MVIMSYPLILSEGKSSREVLIYTLPIFGYNKIVYHSHTNSCATKYDKRTYDVEERER